MAATTGATTTHPTAGAAPAPPAPDRLARGASAVAATVSGALAAFEAALAAGAPWGAAAWGGLTAGTLPTGLRVASGVAAVVWTGAGLVALRHGGWAVPSPVSTRRLRLATSALAGYAALGTVMNLASRSELERAVWTPAALALAVSLTLTAVRGRGPVRSPQPHG